MANDFEPAERGLRDHLALWRRRAGIILGITAVALAVMLGLTLTATKSYQASAQVIFPVEPAGQPGQDTTQIRFDPNRVIQTEAIFAAGDQVRAQVDAKVGAGGTITARGLKDSDIIVITATASDPQRAAELANTAAAVYVSLRQPPAGVGGVQVVDPAEAPAGASSGSMARNLALALAVGLVLGLVAAYAVDHLDDVVRDEDGLERLAGVPVLGLASSSRSGRGIHPVPLDDAVVGIADGEHLVAALLDAPRAAQTRVLLVPVRSRGRDVRDAIGVLHAVGMHVAAAVLVTSAVGPDTHSASGPIPERASDPITGPTPDPASDPVSDRVPHRAGASAATGPTTMTAATVAGDDAPGGMSRTDSGSVDANGDRAASDHPQPADPARRRS